MDYEKLIFVCIRSIQRIIIKHVLAVARDEICKVLDLHTLSAHLWNVVWPLLKHGLWKVIVFDGLRSIPCIIIKHLLAAARYEICKVLDLHTFSYIWTCFNSIGKRHGLMHILDVVLVDKNLCNSMKRTLANVYFISMQCFLNHVSYIFDWFSNAGLH